MALIMEQKIPLVLKVTRAMPELVTPAEPTPREQKMLSDLDDQEGLRLHVPGIIFYKAHPSMDGKDPVKVIKDALAKALVFYYPFAGRLVEGTNRKLIVDCTGEGVAFIEADANASLDDFGPDFHPPFPLEDLLYDIPGTQEMIGTPLLIIQVTRLNTFDLLSASLWWCRTRALGLRPDDKVRLMFTVNASNKFDPPLGKGFYGNACAFPVVCAKVSDICDSQIEYILELIRKTKGKVNEEYMRSIMDLMVTKDRPHYCVYRTYDVSDVRHLGFTGVDFGWGKPIFGGPAICGLIPNASYFISYKNREGESMIMVTISLPHEVMKVFLKDLQGLLTFVRRPLVSTL